MHHNYRRTVRSLWTWLWGRYHIPQNVFLVHYEKEVPLIDNVNLTEYTVCNANKVLHCELYHRCNTSVIQRQSVSLSSFKGNIQSTKWNH